MPLPDNWKKIISFNKPSNEIIADREAGKIYSFDFNSNEGKYISAVINSSDPVDAVLKISPRIEVRLTYIIKKDAVQGVQISKLNNDGSLDKIHLSTLDWTGVLKLLHIFDKLDAKSISSGSLILDKSVVSNPTELEKLLNTIAADPEGKKKLEEVASNIRDLRPGELNSHVMRRRNAELLDDLLNDESFFDSYKLEQKIGKNEEIWQKFFIDNDWLLGSDVVRILEERKIDEDNTVDIPIESADGFLDIIELKLPSAPFWTQEIIPYAELTKALMQCMRYIIEYERRTNDHKKIEELGVDILKPRITLIYGRSYDWDSDTKKQFRVLNSSFHNITVLTYDQVLQRAEKLTGYKRKTRE